MMTAPSRWLPLLCLAGALLLLRHELALLPDGKAHAYILNVGQGDAIFLVSPTGKQVLVDGGPDLSTLEHLGKLMPFFDRSIDLVILTHPHEDHLAALPEVLRRYRVDTIMLAGTQSTNSRYRALIEEVATQKIAVILPTPQEDIDLGDGLVLDVLWPDPGSSIAQDKNVNNASIVVRVLYGGDALLLAGDIEAEAEDAILKSGAPVQARVVKVAHHGSATSSSTGFIRATAATEAVISVGEENSFGHPNQGTIGRWEAQGAVVRTTASTQSAHYVFALSAQGN